MVFIKICGITNLEDALAAIEAGADGLGFNFYRGSSRFIEPRDARRIIADLPQGVLSVGVFVNEGAAETVARLADEANVRAVQLHGDESPEYCRRLKNRFVIKALSVNENFKPESALDYEVDAILLDAFSSKERGGTGQTIDWSIARRTRQLVPKLFLAGGLTPENVCEALSEVAPFAVDACSRLECAPGRKDIERLRAFINAARTCTGDGSSL